MINFSNFYTFSHLTFQHQKPAAIDFTTPKNKKTAWNQRKHTGNTSYVRPGEKLPEAKWKVPTNRFPYLCPTVGLFFWWQVKVDKNGGFGGLGHVVFVQ